MTFLLWCSYALWRLLIIAWEHILWLFPIHTECKKISNMAAVPAWLARFGCCDVTWKPSIGDTGHPGIVASWFYMTLHIRYSTLERSRERLIIACSSGCLHFVFTLNRNKFLTRFWQNIDQSWLNAQRKLHFMWSWTHSELVEESLDVFCWLEAPCLEVAEMVVFWPIWK